MLHVIKIYSAETPLNNAAIAPTFVPTPQPPFYDRLTPVQILQGGGQEVMSVTTTSARQGKFETRFWHKVF